MSSYCDSHKGSEKERYSEASKENQPLKSLDPHQLNAEAWIDDPSLWPEVEFPQIIDCIFCAQIYIYLIDTPGEFTAEKLKAYKSESLLYVHCFSFAFMLRPLSLIILN